MSTNAVPPLFVGLVDAIVAGDAPAASADDSALLTTWLADHRRHMDAWYADLMGVLLLPVDEIDHLRGADLGDDPPAVGLVGEARRIGVSLSAGGALAGWAAAPPGGGGLHVIESAVAKRGEDPMPGLRALVDLASSLPHLRVYAEVPLAWGLLNALDAIAGARSDGVSVAAKFRTGGLAAELFPTPVELAAVICACRDREIPFKLTAGLHRGMRHNDPETGLSHHGFVNIMAACLEAAEGAEVVTVAERLASTDSVPLVEVIRPRRSDPRPLWTGFGSARIGDAIRDLGTLGLAAADS